MMRGRDIKKKTKHIAIPKQGTLSRSLPIIISFFSWLAFSYNNFNSRQYLIVDSPIQLVPHAFSRPPDPTNLLMYQPMMGQIFYNPHSSLKYRYRILASLKQEIWDPTMGRKIMKNRSDILIAIVTCGMTKRIFRS